VMKAKQNIETKRERSEETKAKKNKEQITDKIKKNKRRMCPTAN
jgi:hypothetical protein